MALAAYPAYEIHLSDKGGQYATPNHITMLYCTKLIISTKGRPTKNRIMERINSKFKEGHIDYSEYDSFKDAVERTKYWLECEYMTQRIHSSLAYMTPLEFELA